MMNALDRHQCATLRAFLRERRHGIMPTASSLGSHVRHPSRLGRRVTQEEVAEAIGVSRTWYGLLESRVTIRASAQLLDRLSAALMLTPQDRIALFCLALPELHNVQSARTWTNAVLVPIGSRGPAWSASF